MPVGVGAHQLGGDLGAIDGFGCNFEVMREDAQVEARKVEKSLTRRCLTTTPSGAGLTSPLPSNCTRWASPSPPKAAQGKGGRARCAARAFQIDSHCPRETDTGRQIVLVNLDAQLSLRVTAQRSAQGWSTPRPYPRQFAGRPAPTVACGLKPNRVAARPRPPQERIVPRSRTGW